MRNLFLLSVALSIAVLARGTVLPANASDSDSDSEACWRRSYGIVTQDPIKWCADGQTFLREECYDACDAGFTAGDSSDTSEWEQSDPSESDDVSDYPLITYCWQDCPAGLVDIGAKTCANLTEFGQIYFGYVDDGSDSEDEEKCASKNPQGCEECSDMWVPKSDSGCALYYPVTCPSNMTQNGLNCTKQGYNRVPVSSVQCAPGYQLYNGQCYPPTEEGFTCSDMLCIAHCPQGWEKCGAMCVQNATLCTGTLRKVALKVLNEIEADAYSSDESDTTMQSVASLVPGIEPYLNYPMCN